MAQLRVNPGGQLAPDQVVGRDAFIETFWDALEEQSVVLTAERRMGKTCVVKKMCHEPRKGITPLFRDLEGLRTPLEFAHQVAVDVVELLPPAKRIGHRVTQVLERLRGGELSVGVVGLKLPESQAGQWKVLLETAIADAVAAKGRVVFFWDEVPTMLHMMGRHVGPASAMEVLDTLRALRQTHAPLRMAFTGSIGLHGELARLRREGHANAPVNDMRWLDLPCLERSDSLDLARGLLHAAGFHGACVEETAETICEEVDDIPFYIHLAVAGLREARKPVSAEVARLTIRDRMVDANDAWKLGYYRERIDQYYEGSERALALIVLDALSRDDSSRLAIKELLNLARHASVGVQSEDLHAVVTLLEKDHYLQRGTDGRLFFRCDLIRRWWQVQRGLES